MPRERKGMSKGGVVFPEPVVASGLLELTCSLRPGLVAEYCLPCEGDVRWWKLIPKRAQQLIPLRRRNQDLRGGGT